MIIMFDESEYYSNNLVELAYTNLNGERKIYKIKSGDILKFNEEEIIFDLVVKDLVFQKKQIILYFIFLAFFFPFVILSGVLPTANYKKYRFEIDSNAMISFVDGKLTLVYECKEEVIKYRMRKCNFIFLLFSILWVLILSCIAIVIYSIIKSHN